MLISKLLDFLFLVANDVIDPESVVVEAKYSGNGSESRADGRKIYWNIPESPNGLLLAFRVKVWQDGGNVCRF